MKFALIGLLSIFFCSVVSREVREAHGLPIPPIVTFPAKTPTLLLANLPKKIVDPTSYIKVSAKKHNVQAALVKSIVKAESAFNANAVSSKGAIGLMQLMPETAEQYGADPLVPEQNIEAGTHYLRVLLNKYGRYRNCMQRVIAAYNAGPGIVDKYRGVPPYKETRGYVTRVMTYFRQFKRDLG